MHVRPLGLVIGLLVLLLGAAPASAEPSRPQPPALETSTGPGAASHSRGAEQEVEEAQPPVQSYYHRRFFGEPWRTPARSEGELACQGLGVALASGALLLALRWRRGRAVRRRP